MSINAETLTTKAEARTQAQRDRILAAARACFVKSGFHAASMATIAETAGMSPGLIYRYFENKNVIILAIIERQLEIARERIGQMHASDDLASGIVRSFGAREGCTENSMNGALFLEMSAEATRDPQIAAALRRFDATVHSEVASWLSCDRKDGGYGLPEDVARARALIFVCLIEGLKVREAREPTLDKALLEKALSETVAALVSPPK